ncbi:ATP-dependent helicase HrpB [Leucobacter luti]|uniref:ATP-dependent helicase HrpB n=1 Tax=Leucobacter luti TaxID=340320 RepID=UPI001052928A|nr:ATP-dependent helicase HrpB [Leucobacter luti]MCW2287305.1 ATP-dependent helicase HrpB [Leucobacter luti]TCK41528.1 ATP-dependent helicase HrpB [Leucobacter luti]
MCEGQHLFDLHRIGADLPVANARVELEQAVATGAAVVTAPPGTGKTTYVPPLVANFVAAQQPAVDLSDPHAPVDRPGRVLLSQPRRVAVRAAARRLAALDGSELGGPVGFTVRGERTVGRNTRIEALTPGVLLRRLIADPALDGVSAVVLDEVHERSVDGDLLLGMLAELRELRPELIVIAMSATLNATGIAELLGGAPIVAVPAVLHPLDVAYAPAAARLDERGVTRGFLAHVAELAVAEQAAAGCDALVFVPGAREVDEVVRLIRDRAAARPAAQQLEALPLHGRIPARDQDRAVSGRRESEPQRIVVSTSLAESSLTVPGVRLVIDAGLSREVRRDRGRDMTGLVTVSASRASAEQRAGRAARQGPGRAVRAYSEAEFARMPAAAPAEIMSADLLDAALLLAAWGTPGGVGMRLLTPPPAAAMALATTELRALELTDETGRPTPLGRHVAGLPIGVREARALLSGAAQLGDAARTAEVVAAISDDFRDPGADLGHLLRELRSGRAPGVERWRRECRRLTGIAAAEISAFSPADHLVDSAATETSTDATGIVTALARPEWIARRTGEHSRSYLFASGTRAALPESSALVASEWLAVREVQRAAGRAADGTGAVIRLAAALSETDALRIGGALRRSERIARVTDGRVRVKELRALGAILLSESPMAPRAEDTGPAFAAHLRETGLAALRWTETAESLRGRLGLLHRELGAPWPDVSDTALLAGADSWLGQDLARLGPQSSLHGIDVTSALRRLLPWPEAAQLDALTPEQLAVPSGSRIRISYPDPGDPAGRPVVAVKLQELFGFAQTPRIVNGRVPILFHLLSPARKPLAVTDDLASFWNGPYQDVRKEMRGRYPKHPWPEDPWTAEATARTKRAHE